MNPEDIRREKNRVMQRVQTALDAVPDRIHSQNSYKVAEKLIRLPEFQRANLLGIFVGFDSEVDTVRLMEAALNLDKRVAAPTTSVAQRRLVWREVKNPDADIDLGPLGFPQPLPTCREVDASQFELVAVPGLVWDEKGRRLAHWPGYFDRLLAQIPRIFKVGLVFDLQVVKDLAELAGPALVDALITEDQVRRLRMMAETRPESRRIPGGPKGYKG